MTALREGRTLDADALRRAREAAQSPHGRGDAATAGRPAVAAADGAEPTDAEPAPAAPDAAAPVPPTPTADATPADAPTPTAEPTPAGPPTARAGRRTSLSRPTDRPEPDADETTAGSRPTAETAESEGPARRMSEHELRDAAEPGTGEVTATVIVNAPAERVFAAFTAWDRQGEWIPFTKVRVVEGDGGEGSLDRGGHRASARPCCATRCGWSGSTRRTRSGWSTAASCCAARA